MAHITFKLVTPIEDLIKSIEEASNVKVIGCSVSGNYATIITKEIELDELSASVERALRLKDAYDKADGLWDRFEHSMYKYTTRYDDYCAAKKAYESELVNLALIYLSRI